MAALNLPDNNYAATLAMVFRWPVDFCLICSKPLMLCTTRQSPKEAKMVEDVAIPK